VTDTIVEAIKKLEAKDAVVAVLWFLGVVCPGFLTVFHFMPELAKEYDFLKLMVLSTALSLPVNAFNTIVFSFFR
jgi:hypothetical protein